MLPPADGRARPNPVRTPDLLLDSADHFFLRIRNSTITESAQQRNISVSCSGLKKLFLWDKPGACVSPVAAS